jgi:putative membrane protein
MLYLIINWVSSVACLLAIVALLPGVRVQEFGSALLATGVVGLLSALLGLSLKYANTSLGLLALCSFFLAVADAFLFRVSALLAPGFTMRGFLPAIVGALALLSLNLVLIRLPLRDNPLDPEPLVRS